MHDKISSLTRLKYVLIAILLLFTGFALLFTFFLIFTLPFALAAFAWAGIFLYLAATRRSYRDFVATLHWHRPGIDLDIQYQKQGDSSKDSIYLIGLCPLACAFFRRSSCFSFLDLTLSLASASFFLKGLNIELTSQCTAIDRFILPVLTDFHLDISFLDETLG